MQLERSCGILMHITSLPGKYGIGTLGDEAYQFADQLKAAGQGYWQILPIGPIMPLFGYSPYASNSTFAGNYLFISLEKLTESTWFKHDINTMQFNEKHFIDFEKVAQHKLPLLEKASEDFFTYASQSDIDDYNTFCKETSFWLDDYVLFTALAELHNTHYWLDWEADIARRKPEALLRWTDKLGDKIALIKFIQYIFQKQWLELKNYCSALQIKIIGDIPIYISFDSADAWGHTDILQIDKKTLKQATVAGVPPDYFSKTGQRWGNPLYQWKNADGSLNTATFDWWAKRIERLNKLMHIIRIDHFRGFEAYWSINAFEETAVNGKWLPGPGKEFFFNLKERLGNLPLIAEDLGVITPEVEKLRDDLNLPGMKILQFAFDHDNRNPYLPHNYSNSNFILYTGTHDNNTTNGWFYTDEIDEEQRQYILEYLGAGDIHDLHWRFIRLAYMSTAGLVIIPIQDILGYGEEFRMNTPGTLSGNWSFKLTEKNISTDIIKRMEKLAQLYNRTVQRIHLKS